MALYEFECKECGNVYEYLDLTSDPDMQRPCPKCRTQNGKIMSECSVRLGTSGVGWAKDGYARKYSIADGPENTTGSRHKRSGKTTVPVRGLSIEPNKDNSKKKKPAIKVMK